MVGHEELVGCPVFHESGDQADQVSGYELIRGLARYILDDDGRFYVSLLDEGGGAYRVRLYKYAARTSHQLAYTLPFSTPGPKNLLPADYGVAGQIVVDQIVGQDTDISVHVEYDRSIMYADHMNELYYALELLCYLPLAEYPSVTAVSVDGAYGYGDSPGPALDWERMLEAYEEGWDVFEAGGYLPAWPDAYAHADSHLHWSEWDELHYYGVSDRRVRRADLAIPARLYPAVELAVPFSMYTGGIAYFDIPDRLECVMGEEFSGEPAMAVFGDIGYDEYGDGRYFHGWLAWMGEWPGGAQPFSYRWRQIERYYWGAPEVHQASLHGGIETYGGLYGGFYFAEPGGQGYRNWAWDPVGSGEWGVHWPW